MSDGTRKPATIVADGREVRAEAGSSLLSALIREGIQVPALCHHEAVRPYGACRLCLVEVRQRGWKPGWSRLTTSCDFPVMDGLEISTATEKVLRHRRVVMELILARAPASPVIVRMAEGMGIDASTRFRRQEGEACMLCGLCARVCSEVVGAHAITFWGRGGGKDVGTPFPAESGTCIGCGACDAVCPTGAVGMRDEGGRRCFAKWRSEHALVVCRTCGRVVGTRKQIEWARERGRADDDVLATCPDCRRDRYAKVIAAEGHM